MPGAGKEGTGNEDLGFKSRSYSGKQKKNYNDGKGDRDQPLVSQAKVQ
jgi:hypothetical protein